MPAQNKSLKNHLVRELMHMIRLKENGDAMVSLALSGIEVFPVFEYVVSANVSGKVNQDSVELKNMELSTEGHRRLMLRYVQNVRVVESGPGLLSFDKITDLMIASHQCNVRDTHILDLWKDIEYLRGPREGSVGLLQKLASGGISLPKLRYLELSVRLDQLSRLLTTATIPFPEDVAISIDASSNVANFASLLTFPKVKRLSISISFRGHYNFNFLHQLPYIINHFFKVKTVTLELACERYHWDVMKIAEIDGFHGWVEKANFPVPVDIVCTDIVVTKAADNVANFERVVEPMKTFGFYKYDNSSNLVIQKTFNNVKLTHWLKKQVWTVPDDDDQMSTASDDDDQMSIGSDDDDQMSIESDTDVE